MAYDSTGSTAPKRSEMLKKTLLLALGATLLFAILQIVKSPSEEEMDHAADSTHAADSMMIVKHHEDSTAKMVRDYIISRTNREDVGKQP